MGYVPPYAQWYLAEIVQELTVVGDLRNMVWRNLTLILGDSPESAYEHALSMGRSGDSEYFNPAGNLVTIKFRGISFMDVIHDALEDGAELTFSSQIDVAPDELKRMLRSKEELTLFRRNARLDGPDVASGEIVEEIRMKLGITRP